MKAPKPYTGLYETMEFPEYKYQEYPKYVKLKKKDEQGRDHLIVNNHAEELRAVEEIVTVSTFDTVLKAKEKVEQELALLQKQLAVLAPQDLSDPGLEAPMVDEKPPASPTIRVPESKTK
jgi:hypothetical protein